MVPPFAAWWREITVLTMCIMVEFCFAYFAATYLHDELGLSTAASAAGGAAWGVGMTIGRFVVSVRPAPRSIAPSVALDRARLRPAVGRRSSRRSRSSASASPGSARRRSTPPASTALLARFPASPDQGATRGGIASGMALLSAPALMAGLRAVSDVRTAYLAVPVLLVALAFLAKPIAPVRPVVAEHLGDLTVSRGRRRASGSPSRSS